MFFLECTLKEVLTLGIENIKGFVDYFSLFAPAADEILIILLNITRLSMGHYEHFVEKFIDLFSIIGILVASVNNSASGRRYGILTCILLIIFCFVFAKFFLNDLLNITDNIFLKIIIGILYIYFFKLVVHTGICIFRSIEDYYDNSEEENNKNN